MRVTDSIKQWLSWVKLKRTWRWSVVCWWVRKWVVWLDPFETCTLGCGGTRSGFITYPRKTARILFTRWIWDATQHLFLHPIPVHCTSCALNPGHEWAPLPLLWMAAAEHRTQATDNNPIYLQKPAIFIFFPVAFHLGFLPVHATCLKIQRPWWMDGGW